MILLALLLLAPGRIQGAIFREHFLGRRLADRGKFEESIRQSETFLENRWRAVAEACDLGRRAQETLARMEGRG